jgi:hypothetical protein
MNKIGNTLKMMGVSGRDAMFFEDAHRCYHLTVSATVKGAHRNQMLNTVIMDKTVRQWFEYYIKLSKKMGIKDETAPSNGNPFQTSQFFTVKDFDLNRVELNSINILLELVLQEFYKREKII